MFPYHLKLLFKLSFYTKAILLRKKFQLENNFNNAPCMSQLNRRQESLFSLSATLAKSGPLDFPSEKSFLLFFSHEKGLGHIFQK